jgi:hypothetical protein
MKPVGLLERKASMPHTNMPKMVEHPKEISDPHNENNHYQSIQDRFDLSLHRDKPVYEPQRKSNSNNCKDDGGKRHIMFSSNFSDSTRVLGIAGKFQAIDSLNAAVIRKRRVILRFILILPR